MDRIVISMLCLWGHAVLGTSDIKTIWCVDDDVIIQHNLVKGMRKEDILCTAKEISDYPFTLERHLTPPKPESINVTYRTYKAKYKEDNVNVTSRQIAVLISWTYKIQYFEKVESYHVEVNYFKPPGNPRQYLMTWDANLTSALNSLDAELVRFNFFYCGRPSNFHVHPRDMYRFQIQACPIYSEEDDPQVVNQRIMIPGCDEDRAISKVPQCACEEGYIRKRGICRKAKKDIKTTTGTPKNVTTAPMIGMSKPQQKLSSTHIVLLVIGVVLIIVFIAFAVRACKEPKVLYGCCTDRLESSSSKKRHVLLICTLEADYFEPMNNLIDIFSKFPHLKVKSNLRQRNEIGELGIHEWTKNHINNADVVVFLIASTSETCPNNKKDNENSLLSKMDDQVGLVLKATEKIIINNKADNADKKFIIVDMKVSTKREHPYFKHIKLPSEFNKFAKTVIGDAGSVREKDKRIFLHSLAIAKLGGYGKKPAPDDDHFEKSIPVVEESPELPNDLDCGTQRSKNPSLDIVNITMDGVSLCNSLPSQPYFINTDSNGDASWQLNRSGARPKQLC